MYNKIWSPLKQEFVETLSVEGKKALKMYVNSLMTGGAMTEEDFIEGLTQSKIQKTGQKNYIKRHVSRNASKYGTSFEGTDDRKNIDYENLYKRLGNKFVTELTEKTSSHGRVNQFISNLKKVKDKQEAAQTQAQAAEAEEDSVDSEKFYKLFFGVKKTHDLGEIPKAYGKEGVFIADFGSSDLKFLGENGTEVKYKNKDKDGGIISNYGINLPEYTTDKYFLSNTSDHITLLNNLFKEYVDWENIKDKTLYIRGGSILKKDNPEEAKKTEEQNQQEKALEEARMENLKVFIGQWNETNKDLTNSR